MTILAKIGTKLTEWDQKRYYRKIEDFFKERNWYVPLLELQGSDRKYCAASLRLYSAGYKYKQPPNDIAICLVQSISIYKMDPNKAVNFIEKAVHLLEKEPSDNNRALQSLVLQEEPTIGQDDAQALEFITNQNVNIINSIINQIMNEFSIDTDLELIKDKTNNGNFIESKLGSLGETMAQTNRVFASFFVFGIFCICKIRHEPQYIHSHDYEKTKLKFAMQEINYMENMLLKAGISPDEDKIIEGVSKNMIEIENHVATFFLEMGKGNTNNPEESLINWYKLKTGTTELSGQPLNLRIREYSRYINNLVYVNPPK